MSPLFRRLLVIVVVFGVTRPATAGEVLECIVAEVNHEIVTLSQLKDRRKTVLDDLYRMRLPEEELQERLNEARDKLVPLLIEEKLLVQKAHSVGLEVGPEEVDRIIQQIMTQNQIPDEETLANQLEADGMSLEGLRVNIARRTITEKIKQYEIANKVMATDEEAERYYEKNKEDYREPDKIRVREVVLLFENRPHEEVEKEITELANLARNGADFAELATLFSHAPSAEHGGDLGLITKDELSDEIVAATDDLEIGAVSVPVQTQYGYHILQLVERKDLTYRPLDEVAEEIKIALQGKQFDDRVAAYVERLKANAYIRLNEACYSGIL